MTQFAIVLLGKRNIFIITMFSLVICVAGLFSQPRYRTFNQLDLSEKKEKKVGKAIAANACFTFHNNLAVPVDGLHAKFNADIIAILDSAGFTTLNVGGHQLDAIGITIQPGDSVTFCAVFHKKGPNVNADKWWWDASGARVSPRYSDLPANAPVDVIYRQPNGGTVREYLYKRVITRPAGIVVGLKTDTTGVGWIRYMKDDRMYFPHTDSARCFDFIVTGTGGQHAFVGELKNPHVKKHNNNLLGEVHALKLAVIANDAGVTQPDTPAVRLGDLIYNDLGNPSDPCNNLSIRGVIHLVDSALTYCTHFTAGFYAQLDSCVSRINRAFDGAYVAVSFSPFELEGTHTVAEVPFLHTPPSVAPVAVHRPNYSVADPEQYSLYQNYPNPFNPTTKITFDLPQSSVVTLRIYNILGQEVNTLLNQESMDAGEQTVEFNANNLSSGVYFYRIVASGTDDDGNAVNFQSIKRMMLIK